MTVDGKGNVHAGKGIPVGGQFLAQQRKEGDESLPGQTTAAPAPLEATEEQYARAEEAVLRQLAWDANLPLGDDGAGIERTPEVEEKISQSAARIVELEAALEAWKNGDTHEDDAIYDAIWEGDQPGYDRDMVTKNLRQYQTDLVALGNGTLSPKKVIGNSYKRSAEKKLAEKWLADGIATWKLALECGGKNLSVNQANVRYRKRTAATAAVAETEPVAS